MDPEEVSGTTLRYNKTVFQLEKGLPPNSVVPKLKQKVDSMKDKVRLTTDPSPPQYLTSCKPSAIGQPTRPTQPFILLGVDT